MPTREKRLEIGSRLAAGCVTTRRPLSRRAFVFQNVCTTPSELRLQTISFTLHCRCVRILCFWSNATSGLTIASVLRWNNAFKAGWGPEE